MDATATDASDPSSNEEQVLLVGSNSEAFGPNRVGVVFLDKKHRQSSILTSLPYDCSDYISVCSAPDGFIISGGKNNSNNDTSFHVKRFSIISQLWTDLPDMVFACSHHGSVFINNRFFTVAGLKGPKETLSDVHMLDLDSLAWTNCQSLETCVTCPGIAAVDTDFLVLGVGFMSTQTCKYDSHTGKRKSCQPMPKECVVPYNRTAVSGKKVFVLHFDARVFLVYDVVTDQWSELSSAVKPVMHSAMVFFAGRLVVTGGCEFVFDTNITPAVQSYDIENRKWWLLNNKLPVPLQNHAAIVVKVGPPSLLSGYMGSLGLLSLILPVLLILCYLFLA